MTPEDFKERAQELCEKYCGLATESWYAEVMVLLFNILKQLGYEEGIQILQLMDSGVLEREVLQ